MTEPALQCPKGGECPDSEWCQQGGSCEFAKQYQPDPDLCHICQHPTRPHQICGYPDKQLGFPVEGWRQCPVPGCNCHSTWSLAPKLLETWRRQKSETGDTT